MYLSVLADDDDDDGEGAAACCCAGKCLEQCASFLRAGDKCGFTESVELMLLLDVHRAPDVCQFPYSENLSEFSFPLNCQYFMMLN